MSAENEALGIAGFVVAGAVLSQLRAKGIFTQSEIVSLLDGASFLMERLGLTDEAKRNSHTLVETMLEAFAQEGHQPPTR